MSEQSNPIVLRELFFQKHDSIASTLPSTIDPDRFIQVALLAATKNKGLRSCSKESILLAVMEAARAGLQIDNKEATVIPFKGMAQFMPMVDGIRRLMLRSPNVMKVEARVVYEGDEFDYEYGIRPNLVHKPLVVPQDDLAIAAYAIMWIVGTDPQFEVMVREEIEQVRAVSSARSGPWNEWYGEMARKTVVKRLAKYADLSPEAQKVIAMDHQLYGDPTMDDYVDGLSPAYRNEQVKHDTEQRIGKLKTTLSAEMVEEESEGDEEEPSDDSPQVADLVSFIAGRVNVNKGSRKNDELVKTVAWMLGECFEGRESPDDDRHRFNLMVFGKASTKDLTGAELRSVLDFLDAKKGKDDKYHPNALRAQDARLLADAVLDVE
jgi:recombination protein RecT